MKLADTEKPSVAFIPSAVTGLSGVSHVEVTSVQIRLQTDSETHEYALGSFARYPKSPFARLYRRPAQGIVGVLHFDKTTYQNSYVRFFTSPEITVYMPAEGPSRYPESLFWKIQSIVAAGHFLLMDASEFEKRSHLAGNEGPLWSRVVRDVFGSIGVLNFIAFWVIGLCIGGSAEPHVRYQPFYLKNNGRRTEVSEAVWTYSYWHTRITICTFAPLPLAGLLIWKLASEHAKRCAK